jgi:hypothetical protein
MNVYTRLAADGTFIVVTESDPFDTFKAAKREELKQAERIGEREGANRAPNQTKALQLLGSTVGEPKTPEVLGARAALSDSLLGDCDECERSGVLVAEYGVVKLIGDLNPHMFYVCHACIADMIKQNFSEL